MSRPLHKQATNSQYGYVLLTTNYALLMNIYNGYFTQWLRSTMLRNEAQSQTFWRNNISIFGKFHVLSANCPFGKMSVRLNVRSAKCPFGKMSFGKISFGRMSFGKVSLGKMSGYTNIFLLKM